MNSFLRHNSIITLLINNYRNLFGFLIAFLLITVFIFTRKSPIIFSSGDEFRELGKKILVKYEQQVEEMKNQVYARDKIIFQLQEDFKNLNHQTNTIPKYRKRPETDSLQCDRILKNDKNYIEQMRKNRAKLIENAHLDMSCSAINQRIIPISGGLKSLKFGISFARNVYKDYEMVEDQVRFSFHPQNSFCFAIDRKSTEKFHKRMRALASCLPNVILLIDELNVDSSGHNTNFNHYNCMKALINKPGWNYLILLQNHDVITKSVYELERIFELLAGANDVEITSPAMERISQSFEWTPKNLKLFKNETGLKTKTLTQEIKFAKGAAQSSLSWKAVEWLVRKVDLTNFLKQLNSGPFGVDELSTQSLQVSDQLEMPGHFTDECLKQNKNTDFISRMSKWMYGNSKSCASGFVRHSICIFGIEDLRAAATFPNIMFNKMIPEFDYGIVDCIGELIYNRTYLNQNDHSLEEKYYSNMVNVLYHQNHKNRNYRLNCTPSYVNWKKRKYPV